MFSIQIAEKNYTADEFLAQKFEEPWLIDIANALEFWLSNSSHFVVQTSGSTSVPNSITINKKQIRKSAGMCGDYFGYSAGKTACLCIPVNRIGGMMVLFRALVYDMKLICMMPKDIHQHQWPAENIFTISLLPNQLFELLKSDHHLSRLHSISNVLIGGSNISYAMYERLSTWPTAVYQTFGMTETISHIALHRIGKTEPNTYFCYDDVKISVNRTNCLCIECPDLLDVKLETKDVAEILSEKTFKWIGRLDNVINSAGVKIYSEELESALAHLLNDPFFITGMTDEKYGMVPVLYVSNQNYSTKEKLIELNSKLPPAHRLKKVFFCPDFIYTFTGKINRKATVANCKAGSILAK